MKTKGIFMVVFVFIFTLFGNVQRTDAQLLKKLKKRTQRAAEEAVIRKTEQKVYKETSKKMDTILGNDTQKENSQRKCPVGNQPKNNENEGLANYPKDENSNKLVRVNSKFDFVPGEKIIFYDDFSNDFIGDFPSKWNTNGGGEVVTINDTPNRYFELNGGNRTFYIPDLNFVLPEEYTLEFDLLVKGIDNKTSSVAKLTVTLSDNNQFSNGVNFAKVSIPFCQYTPIGIAVLNSINRISTIRNSIDANLREIVLYKPHISIAVNKTRFRMYINQIKYIDIPRLIAPNNLIKYIKFSIRGFAEGKEHLFISNVKVAKGGLDLRRQLIKEGKVSTNGILFNVNSSVIKPQSFGIIRQISQVLKQDNLMRLKIIGYTDSDGSEASNLKLSEKRAEAVKKALIEVYGVKSARLFSEGKGESKPVGDNKTKEGKALNRRVEFIKL